MRPISACYTSGRGAPHFLGLGRYTITGEGVLLLHGRGVKIHLRKGVVTLRDALDLHALPKRVVSRRLLADFRDNSIVLNTDTNATTPTDMCCT